MLENVLEKGERGGHNGVGLSGVTELILRTLKGGCKYWCVG